MIPNVRVQFVLVYTAPKDWKAVALEDLSAALAAGALQVGEEAGMPLHHYRLGETSAAQAAVESGVVGKVLVDLVED